MFSYCNWIMSLQAWVNLEKTNVYMLTHKLKRSDCTHLHTEHTSNWLNIWKEKYIVRHNTHINAFSIIIFSRSIPYMIYTFVFNSYCSGLLLFSRCKTTLQVLHFSQSFVFSFHFNFSYFLSYFSFFNNKRE